MYNLKRYHYSPRSIVYTCHSTHLQRFNVQAIVFLRGLQLQKAGVKKHFLWDQLLIVESLKVQLWCTCTWSPCRPVSCPVSRRNPPRDLSLCGT